MTLPKLPGVADIHTRLERLFTPGLEMRKNLVREMTAKTVFVFLYGGMVDGAARCLRPSHVYFFTEDQAQKTSDEDRLQWLAAGKIKSDDEVLVNCPDGTVAKLSPGPSSIISKAVVEQFASSFLTAPALLWLSESGAKVRYQDEKTAKALGLDIDQSKVLPDIILANVGDTGEDTHLVFVEVVASDGPMSQARRDALLQYIMQAGFPEDQCLFGTAFEDRADSAFKKCLPELAWGTFVWFRSEPDCLVWLYDEPFSITNSVRHKVE